MLSRSAPLSERLPPRRPAELTPRAAEPAGQTAEPPARTTPGSDPSQPSDARVRPSEERSSCLSKLIAIPGNRVAPAVPQTPPGETACRVEDPVRVEALAIRGADGAAVVAFEPPPLISCAMASAVAEWLDSSVQPLARGYFDSALTGLRVGGGHECRRRNGASTGTISEHATGQALDIFAFKLEGERAAHSISVEKPAGLTENRFLDAVRQSACGAFMTALGPGSDAAHANHLHVDIQARRSQASRFCQ